jgi:hypothetical protein
MSGTANSTWKWAPGSPPGTPMLRVGVSICVIPADGSTAQPNTALSVSTLGGCGATP